MADINANTPIQIDIITDGGYNYAAQARQASEGVVEAAAKAQSAAEAAEKQSKTVEDILAKGVVSLSDPDIYVVSLIDGTADGFHRAMKLYMSSHKITDKSTAATITDAVTGFYKLMERNFSWDGGTRFTDPDVSSVSTGERFGDNEGLSCTPSSAQVKGRDDYEGLPLFACTDVNWIITDGNSPEIQITAIDGIVGNFKRYDVNTFVGVLTMAGYHYYTNPGESSNQTYMEGYRIGENKMLAHCECLPEAKDVDGTIRPWVVHAKYAAGLNGNKFTCCSGIVEAGQQSHNSSQLHALAVGANYGGLCACDLGFLQIMNRIKYASLTCDGTLNFAYNYYNNSIAQIAETNVKRVIIASGEKSKYIVGSNVQIGTGATDDPQVATTYNISGADGWTVTAVTDVTIDGTKYAAVYVDADKTFNTAAKHSDDKDNTQIRTIRWKTGSTDNIKANDGAIDPKSGKYPCKIQGIEFGLGAYEVLADTIFKLYKDAGDETKYWYEPYTVKRGAKQATSITADYASAGVKFTQDMPEGWIKAQTWGKDGVLLPTKTGGSSSTYARDYIQHDENTVDTRAWLALGSLVTGADAGLSYLNGDYWLGNAWWSRAGRLSPNVNRG